MNSLKTKVSEFFQTITPTRKTVKTLLSILTGILVVAGLAFGIYMGFLGLYQSIVNIIDQVRSPVMDSLVVAWAIIRIFTNSLFLGLWVLVCMVPAAIVGIINASIGSYKRR